MRSHCTSFFKRRLRVYLQCQGNYPETQMHLKATGCTSLSLVHLHRARKVHAIVLSNTICKCFYCGILVGNHIYVRLCVSVPMVYSFMGSICFFDTVKAELTFILHVLQNRTSTNLHLDLTPFWCGAPIFLIPYGENPKKILSYFFLVKYPILL